MATRSDRAELATSPPTKLDTGADRLAPSVRINLTGYHTEPNCKSGNGDRY